MNEKVKTLISFTLNCIDKIIIYLHSLSRISEIYCIDQTQHLRILFFTLLTSCTISRSVIFWGAFVFSQVVRDLHMEIILLIIVDKMSVVIFFSYYYYYYYHYYFIFFLYFIIFPYKNIIAKKFAI